MARPLTIGFVAENLSDAYIGGLLNGVYAVACQRGLHLITFQGNPKDLSRSRVAGNLVDGWIAAIHADGIPDLARADVPLVTIAAHVPGICPAVMADNYGGAYEAACHLVDHGHQRIAFAGWMEWDDIKQRHAGYQAALVDRGLPIDPRLTLALAEHDQLNGRQAAERLIADGMPCTAVICAADDNAIGLIAGLRAAGYRVPEDVAVIGFNDEHAAQYATPPLTSVRQRLAALGCTAVEALLDQLAGQSMASEVIAVPTTLVLRASCGCRALLDAPLAPVGADSTQEWRDALSKQLVRLVLHPLAPDQSIAPEQSWPGVTILTQALEAAIYDSEAPSAIDLGQAWAQAVELTSNFETHLSMLALLESAGAARLASAPDPAAAPANLSRFLDRARLDLLRAHHTHDLAWVRYLERLVQITDDITSILFDASAQPAPSLAWLRRSTMVEGILALWSDADNRAPAALVGAAAYSRAGRPTLAIGRRYDAAAFPPADFWPPPAHTAEPDVLMLLPIRTSTHDWGILALRGPLMVGNRLSEHITPNTISWATQLGTALERAALRAEVAEQQAILQAAYDRERALAIDNARLYHLAQQSELAVRQANDILEQRIAERTAELQAANTQLHAESAHRAQAEEERLALERRLLETQKLESLGVLAGGIAHDFNNLLVAILGNAGLALMDLEPTAAAHKSVMQIEIAAQRAADLTRQMLAYAGRGRFVVKRFNLGTLVEEMVDLLQAAIAKNVTLRCDTTSDLPAVEADATQIRQIVMNLVINASEAIGAQEGNITISTGVRHVDRAYLRATTSGLDVPDGTYVYVAVADTGAGMNQQNRARIFEPFFSTKFTGRGLGLAAALGIVRSHNGTLVVESAVGRGSTFTVLLPAAGPAAEALTAPAAREAWHGHGTVLVVDDEAAVRMLVARVLERGGLTVLTAIDGRSGIEAFQAHTATIDCVLLDLTMPHMSGDQAFMVIHDLKPGVPVVLMSGFTTEDVVSRFGDIRPVAFLQKPFTPQDLSAIIQKTLKTAGTTS